MARQLAAFVSSGALSVRADFAGVGIRTIGSVNPTVQRHQTRIGYCRKATRSKIPTMTFTGIVEEIGSVRSVENIDSEEGGANIGVMANITLEGVKVGDSISVNGTCLTVTQIKEGAFWFDLAPETLRRTTFGGLQVGNKVNLERSMAADGRFGGHLVQGHVDCVGTITSVKAEKDNLWYTIQIPSEYMKLVVEKGYVSVDGTSLTVCDIKDEESSFTFTMIKHTQKMVVTGSKREGSKVNIEMDITGKYIARMLEARLS